MIGLDITSDHITSLPYFTLLYLILPYLTLPYLTLPYLNLPYIAFPQRPSMGSVSIGGFQDFLQRGHTDALERKLQYSSLLHSNSHSGAVNLLVRVFFSALKVHRVFAIAIFNYYHAVPSSPFNPALPYSALLCSALHTLTYLFYSISLSFAPFHFYRTRYTYLHRIL